MRRTASEVLRSLEMRVARLERSAGNRTASWDMETNLPANVAIRGLVGVRISGGWELEYSNSGATVWSRGSDFEDNVYMRYEPRKDALVFEREDEYGDTELLASFPMRKVGVDFVGVAKKVLSRL